MSDLNEVVKTLSELKITEVAELVKMLDDNGLRDLFDRCEMPLVMTLSKMEFSGIKCDPDILKNIGSEIRDSISSLEKRIYDEAGQDFNINSPKQLSAILFEQMGIPYPKAK